jgi:L-glutamine-phosphate cytidylyltransferase
VTARRALLLAAGRGRRLAPLTDDRPKCLVPLLGLPLIEHQLASLSAAGVERVAVVGGYRAGRLAAYGDTHFRNDRWETSNMVTSLRCADAWLRAGPTIVAYTDLVYGPDAVRALATAPADLAITYDPHWREAWTARFAEPLDDAERFALDPFGAVAEIGGRAASMDEIEGQYMGLLRITPVGWARVRAVLDEMPDKAVDRLDMTALLSLLVEREMTVLAVEAPWPWAEVDSVEDLRRYEVDEAFAPLQELVAVTR